MDEIWKKGFMLITVFPWLSAVRHFRPGKWKWLTDLFSLNKKIYETDKRIIMLFVWCFSSADLSIDCLNFLLWNTTQSGTWRKPALNYKGHLHYETQASVVLVKQLESYLKYNFYFLKGKTEWFWKLTKKWECNAFSHLGARGNE